MATTQTGPRLRIAGSCEGCCHLRGEEKVSRPRLIVSYVYHCGQPTMLKVHPFGAKPRKIGRTPATPAWCPELPAARLALARSVVVEGPFPRAGDAWFDAWAQSRGEDPNR